MARERDNDSDPPSQALSKPLPDGFKTHRICGARKSRGLWQEGCRCYGRLKKVIVRAPEPTETIVFFIEVLVFLCNCAGSTRFSRHTVVARERDNDSDPPSQTVAQRIAVVGPGRVEAFDRKVADVMVG